MKVFVLLAFLSLASVRGDTPANCLFEDIIGTWTFTESERIGDHTIKCDSLGEVIYTKEFTLEFPNTVTDELGNKGTWTMIYNQGFEVNIDERSYFAFSRYEGSFSSSISYCDETFVGWSRDKTVRNWSCFQGKKHNSVPTRVTQKMPHPLPARNFINDHDFINKINSVQSSWRAKAYPEFEKYTLEEMLRRAGGPGAIIPNSVSPAPATEEQKARAAYLPVNFDWRDVEGVNYVSPVRDQMQCGSCYAFASLATIEARLRISTRNRRQDVFSVQDIVECSFLSQGCGGGFSYLIAGRYAQDQGVVAEECNPYLASDNDKCGTDISCRRTYVSEFAYVGGFYGGCNEELMMEALVAGGPFSVGYMVYDDFRQYESGVYKHTGVQSQFNPLVATSHAVLVVGYGIDETTGEKYWTCKNSWGDSWGDNGYFKILRGTNECGIESKSVISTPIP